MVSKQAAVPFGFLHSDSLSWGQECYTFLREGITHSGFPWVALRGIKHLPLRLVCILSFLQTLPDGNVGAISILVSYSSRTLRVVIILCFLTYLFIHFTFWLLSSYKSTPYIVPPPIPHPLLLWEDGGPPGYPHKSQQLLLTSQQCNFSNIYLLQSLQLHLKQ